MPIRVLDAHTAELIAAGEGVERPASVMKELLENAFDAGAKHIEAEIENGGVRLMRVQDDGCGMAFEEVPVAFLRHATSKVSTKADLEAIDTLGFRGEALASIAAVSKVEVLTREKNAQDACIYGIEGGVETLHTEAARAVGTTFGVRELFYNTPARMKFLKKDASEAAFITELVGRLALSHPEVSLRYVRDGKEIFSTPGQDDLPAAIYAVLGKEVAKAMVCTSFAKPPHHINGYVCLPGACRKSRSMQYFYINGRFVKSRTMMAALEQAYRGKLMQGHFPSCVLFLQMPPELLDVNVHPAKTEVRFANEAEVFSAVYAAVKETLEREQTRHTTVKLTQSEPQKQVPIRDSVPIPAPQTSTQPLPMQNENKANLRKTLPVYQEMVQTLSSSEVTVPYRVEKAGVQARGEREATARPGPDIFVEETHRAEILPIRNNEEQEKAQSEQELGEKAEKQTVQQLSLQIQEDEAALCYVGELFSTYVLAQREETLYVIDKHAAHERILYEKLAEDYKNVDAQMLLCPVAVLLGGAEKAALLENEDILKDSGLELEEFGGKEILVRSVPADIRHEDIEGLLLDVAKGFLQGGKTARDKKTEWVLHSMACRAAVKGGDKTPKEQLLQLAKQILQGEVPPFCPHGRPVVLEITRKELEKQFGRLG